MAEKKEIARHARLIIFRRKVSLINKARFFLYKFISFLNKLKKKKDATMNPGMN